MTETVSGDTYLDKGKTVDKLGSVDDGSGAQQGLRAASGGWFGVAIDAFTALVGLSYLSLRRSYGTLVRSPAMFDIVRQAHYRQLAANLPHTAVYVLGRKNEHHAVIRILIAIRVNNHARIGTFKLCNFSIELNNG